MWHENLHSVTFNLTTFDQCFNFPQFDFNSVYECTSLIELVNKTQNVSWCSNDFALGGSQEEETITMVILLAVIFSIVTVLVTTSIIYLFLLDKMLACIKLLSLPSESSLCSQDSKAGVMIHSFSNQCYPNASKIFLRSPARSSHLTILDEESDDGSCSSDVDSQSENARGEDHSSLWKNCIVLELSSR